MYFYKYPSIENFQNFIKTYKGKQTFVGLTEDKQPIFKQKTLDSVTLIGTIKLHGTNAGVTVLPDGTIYIQKRSDSMLLDPKLGHIHFGFMQFVYENKQWFIDLANQIDDNRKDPITFFGEWCGPGIQKGVGISQIDVKRFFIFAIQIQGESPTWLDFSNIPYKRPNERIWFINMFGKYTLNANFNDAVTLLQQLDAITLAVENECPVAKEFGVSGIGEGVVWSGRDSDGMYIQFKHKGTKHQKPKGPRSSNPDVKIENPNIQKFIDTIDIDNRLQQCYHELYENSIPSRKETSAVLNWVYGDICKEESHLIQELSLELINLRPALMEVIRNKFFDDINNSL